jgi:hypothetical protein
MLAKLWCVWDVLSKLGMGAASMSEDNKAPEGTDAIFESAVDSTEDSIGKSLTGSFPLLT